MRRTTRTWLAIGIVVIAVALALGIAVFLRGRAAPEAARLLPPADGIVYVNLRPIRTFTDLGKDAPKHDPEYQKFEDETGFQFERDLDEAAFAVHASAANYGPSAPNADSRYSEVVIGKFNNEKLTAFLRRLATATEKVGNKTIYLIPHEERIVRVCILSPDTVAASNTDSADPIHHIIEQYNKAALPFGGPPLLERYYKELPFGSQAWFIANVMPSDNSRNYSGLPLWPMLRRLFSGGTVVASVRYTGSIQLRADTFISGDAASRLDEQLQNALDFLKKLEISTSPTGSPDDARALLDSIKIERKDDRVTLTASASRDLLKKLFEAPVEPAPQEPPPPEKKPAPKAKRHSR